jgi:hypothetical protein
VIAGAGFTDAEGVYHLGEADNPDGTYSGLMQLVTEALSARLALDTTALASADTRLDTLEDHDLERRQLDTTDSEAALLTQSGIGKRTGTGATSVSETVTFPEPFSAVPVVVLNYIGYRNTGVFNAVGLSQSGALDHGALAPSTTGFTAWVGGATLANTIDWYYSWIAIGPRA